MPPFGFGISTRFTGLGTHFPARSFARIFDQCFCRWLSTSVVFMWFQRCRHVFVPDDFVHQILVHRSLYEGSAKDDLVSPRRLATAAPLLRSALPGWLP